MDACARSIHAAHPTSCQVVNPFTPPGTRIRFISSSATSGLGTSMITNPLRTCVKEDEGSLVSRAFTVFTSTFSQCSSDARFVTNWMLGGATSPHKILVFFFCASDSRSIKPAATTPDPQPLSKTYSSVPEEGGRPQAWINGLANLPVTSSPARCMDSGERAPALKVPSGFGGADILLVMSVLGL